MASASYIDFVHKLLNPVPQYMLGCLPAIAIVGESSRERFTEKIAWVLRCLGCPFTGLFYFCNIGSTAADKCLYWLPSNYFKTEIETEGRPVLYDINCRPVGVHIMIPSPN